MTLSRRRFVSIAGAAAGTAALGATAWGTLVRESVDDAASEGPSTTTTLPSATGRVLVVVQLNGGNDALNTLVPATGTYYDQRPAVNVSEADVVGLAGHADHGLHPSLEPLLQPWGAGELAIIAGVGIEGQTRSHFSAGDTWASAEVGVAPTTGWIGRWLDATGEATNPLRGVSLGDGAAALRAETLQATAVGDPATFALLSSDASNAEQLAEAFLATSAPLSPDETLGAAQMALPSALEAVELLEQAKVGGEGAMAEYDSAAPTVTSLLDTTAGLIDLDVGTEVVVVGIGGFDTHAEQLAVHGGLLDDVAAGIVGFLEEIDRQGRHDDVLVLTTSEFGRRVGENASGGTDHGSAGVQFLAGAPVGGGVVGTTDLDHLDDGDLQIEIDARSMYAAVLDWLGGDAAGSLTDEVLGGSHDRLGLI